MAAAGAPQVEHLVYVCAYVPESGQSVQDMRTGGRASRTQYQYALQDADLEELQTWSPKVLAALRKLPELRDVNTDQQTAGIQLDVTIDRDSAARLGITMQTIDDTLYNAFGQRQVATSFTALNYYRVVLEATPGQQASPDQLAHVYLRRVLASAELFGVRLEEIGREEIASSLSCH